LAEYKRQVGVAVTVGVLIAAFVGVLAITTAPVNVTTTSSQSSSTTTNPVSTSSSGLTSTTTPITGQLGSWNLTTSYPLPLTSMSCVTSGGFVYCVGGGDETAPRGSGGLNNTYYAPLSPEGVGQWIKTTDYPLTIQSPTCIASSGYVYCVGGFAGATSNLTSDVFYAPLSPSGIGRWTQSTTFPNLLSLPPCVVDSSYIYCVAQNATGHFIPAGNTYFAPLSATGVGKWTESSQVPIAPEGCVASGGYAYCFGGACVTPGCMTPSYYAPLSSQGVGPWNPTSNLTGAQDVYAAGSSYLYFFAVPNPLVASLSTSGIGSWTATTPYPQESPAGCFTNAGYLYCIGSNRIDVIPSENVYFARIGYSSTSGGAGASSNAAVATVTVTETLTTQASQATTTYAQPTSNCTELGGAITTTTTITVGPTPPSSTTTTTVTTTSTSYTKTVTVTSCTYSMPTVTSTVTTTVTP